MPFDVCLDISSDRSSLIRKIEYNEDLHLLVVYFRSYYIDHLSYEGVAKNHFEEFLTQKSVGKYYLQFIKPNFKIINFTKMADRPKTKNEASNQKRFIKMSINVQEIIKDWIVAGEKGAYLNVTLQMLPDGEMDRYGNLGMITQDVPKSVYEKEKNLPKAERTKGNILGNACEFAFVANEGVPGTNVEHPLSEEAIGDLPF